MKLKHYLITAASCMAILGSGVSYADATASWHATSEHHRKAQDEGIQFESPIRVDELIKRLHKTLSGELALSDKQTKNIQVLADNANKTIEGEVTKLHEAQKGFDAFREQPAQTPETFSQLHLLLNDRALATSNIMFEKEQFLFLVNNTVLTQAQREVVQKTLKKEVSVHFGEHHRKDPNEDFSPQRQPITRD